MYLVLSFNQLDGCQHGPQKKEPGNKQKLNAHGQQ